jgi:hypothetical protein
VPETQGGDELLSGGKGARGLTRCERGRKERDLGKVEQGCKVLSEAQGCPAVSAGTETVTRVKLKKGTWHEGGLCKKGRREGRREGRLEGRQRRRGETRARVGDPRAGFRLNPNWCETRVTTTSETAFHNFDDATGQVGFSVDTDNHRNSRATVST